MNFKEWMVKSILVRAEHRDAEIKELRKFKADTTVCSVCSIQNCGGYYCQSCLEPTHFSCMIGITCVNCAKQRCIGCAEKYKVEKLREYYDPCSSDCVNKREN